MKTATLVLAALLALGPATARAADYVQAPGSTLAFGGTFQGEPFAGRFPGFATTLSFDPDDLAQARLEVDIPLATATTGNPDYDDGLRGTDFLDASRFPRAHYRATRFRALGAGRYAADGSLSLRGVEQPVTLEFTWTPGASPLLVGKATVHRLAFGVGGGDWADTGMIPDAIAISTRVRLVPR